MLDELKEKVEFVNQLKEALIKVQFNIQDIAYKVFKYANYEAYVEYLVITYKGGATTVRNCTGNSGSAIFQEVAKYLNSGYYDEVDYYTEYILNSPNYISIY